jgi:hypothetical protein
MYTVVFYEEKNYPRLQNNSAIEVRSFVLIPGRPKILTRNKGSELKTVWGGVEGERLMSNNTFILKKIAGRMPHHTQG